MGIITTEGYSRGYLASMGYGGTFASPEPPISERVPSGIQIPAPQHKQAETEYTVETVAKGHRNRDYTIVCNGYKELQKRYRQEHFVIQESFNNVFKGFHEPGAEFKFSDLLAYYPFDGDSTERLLDKSGNGKDLVLAGSPAPTFISGQDNNAICFPLVGGGKAFRDGSLLPANETGFSSFSLSFWLALLPVYLTSGDPNVRSANYLLYRHQGEDVTFDVQLTADRRIRVAMYNANSDLLAWFSETPIIATSFFQHFVITYRKSYQNSSLELGYPIIKLFVDKEEKLISLYEADENAPRELFYSGDTHIGTDSGCALDDFRVYGHDLSESEVITDYNYHSRLLIEDTFRRETSDFPLWTIVGTPYILEDKYGIIPDGSALVSNHLSRSKMFEIVSKVFIRLAEYTADASTTFSASVKDGNTYIEARLVVARGASETTLSLSIIVDKMDGSTLTYIYAADPVTVPTDGEAEYVVNLWGRRDEKNFSIYYSIDQLSHPLPTQDVLSSILAPTFVRSVKVTGDYAFASQFAVTGDSPQILMGLSHYEARNTISAIIYTPEEIITDETV